MLNQLIESKSSRRESVSRAKYLFTTSVLVLTLAFSGVLWSLFAKDLAMGRGETMEFSRLLSPVALPEIKPQPPAPVERQPKTDARRQVSENTRQANILRIDENPKVPQTISATANQQKSRPNAPFKISAAPESDFQGAIKLGADQSGDNGGGGIGIGAPEKSESSVVIEKTKTPPPAPEIKIAAPVKEKKKQLISAGVVNGKAINLPKPLYSAAAKSVNAAGEVAVQVTIDESGSVISSAAVSGHPLLRAESEKAARNAKFSPTFLSGEAVKVTGVIVYKFTK